MKVIKSTFYKNRESFCKIGKTAEISYIENDNIIKEFPECCGVIAYGELSSIQPFKVNKNKEFEYDESDEIFHFNMYSNAVCEHGIMTSFISVYGFMYFNKESNLNTNIKHFYKNDFDMLPAEYKEVLTKEDPNNRAEMVMIEYDDINTTVTACFFNKDHYEFIHFGYVNDSNAIAENFIIDYYYDVNDKLKNMEN